jgi:aerobic carbon-monoxide dehydrogenase medium subunit
MYPTTYLRPASLAQAVAALNEHPEAKALAGGMTLVPTLKQRLAAPSHLVDVTRLPELKGITLNDGVLRIGAATRHAEVARSPVVRTALPALAKLASLIGDQQVRNRGTIGGSLANSDPAADYPAAVLGLGATIVTDRRRIAADAYFTGMFQTALEPSEIIAAVEIPLPRRAGYEKQPHPASGYAVAGVFIAETSIGVRVAVTGAGACAFRWTEAERALAGSVRRSALDGLVPSAQGLNDDVSASADYRAHLVATLARRVVASFEAGTH